MRRLALLLLCVAGLLALAACAVEEEPGTQALGRLRAITVKSESLTSEADRLRAALAESRALVGELEAREASRRRWFRRG